MNWQGKINIPERIVFRTIGKNKITQKVIKELSGVEATISDSTNPNFLVVRTNLRAPLNEILLSKTKSVSVSMPNDLVLIPRTRITANTDFSQLVCKWAATNKLVELFDTPEKIANEWIGKFVLSNNPDNQGLRKPQIGALHSTAAYFYNDTLKEPATVVLPTGVGKTETMIAWMLYKRIPKVIVLVPSIVLKKQIGDKFLNLGILQKIGVIPEGLPGPRVCILNSKIANVEEAKELAKHCNVIVTIPTVLDLSGEEVTKELIGNFDNLFIDEAHHAPARTWNLVRNYLGHGKILQFTATPFRNDGKHIGGNIIFNYKLSEAQADNVFKKIRVTTIEEYGELENRDRKIAQKAVEILRQDISSNLDHRLMARVDSISRAEELLLLYQGLAQDLQPVAIHSEQPKALNRSNIQRLITGPAKIAICVDSLGEGFDLPELKIAAIHDPHKSLTVTLQFIGRFTRQDPTLGDAAVVINTGDPGTSRTINKLYSENPDWGQILSYISENRIDKEIKLQDLYNQFKERGDLAEQISLWSLRPNFMTKIYKIGDSQWDLKRLEAGIPSRLKTWSAEATNPKILLIVGQEERLVRWASHKELKDLMHNILLMYWSEENKCVFVYSNEYDSFGAEKLVEKAFDCQPELIAGEDIFNILDNVQLPLVKNLGASKLGSISFTSYFGPNVTEGMSEVDREVSELNNIGCLGYEDGERVVWGGAKRKGKIWTVENGTILEWKEWCDKVWTKVTNRTGEPQRITERFLKPVRIDQLPSSYPIGVEWGDYLQLGFSNSISIAFDSTEVPFQFVEINPISQDETGLVFELATDYVEGLTAKYKLEVSGALPGGYKYSRIEGSVISIRRGRGALKVFEEYCIQDPVKVRYADGTVLTNCYLVDYKLSGGIYPVDLIDTWNWSGVQLNAESMGKTINQTTIQYRAFQELEADFDLVFNDDSAGEAADLICLKDIDQNTMLLTLIHCKNAVDGIVSGRIDNLYTVCGQAQKSIRVKHGGLEKMVSDMFRRNKKWSDLGYDRFLKGDSKTLNLFKNMSLRKRLLFEVIIVQPGLSKSQISQECLSLLATTELFISKTTQGKLRVILSD
jgi:superfamily II DNA or RNA helicase